MQATAEQWCYERLAAAVAPWPLIQVYIPENQKLRLLAGNAFLRALIELVSTHREPDVAGQTLSWWQHELSQHSQSGHPAFIAMRETGLSDTWDWSNCSRWCEQLRLILEADTPIDQAHLWQQTQSIAGQGVRLLEAAINPPEAVTGQQQGPASEIYSALLTLELTNQLSTGFMAERWLPLSLHARYALKLDQQRAYSSIDNGLELAIKDLLSPVIKVLSSGALEAQLVGLIDSVDPSWLRMLSLQRILGIRAGHRLLRSAKLVWRQPVNTAGLLSGWYCWRAIRRLGI